MKISLDVVLKDIPGQLVKALEPISQFGGNIISIVHLRETLKEGRVPVHVVIEVENGKLEKIIKELEARDIWVSKVGEVKKRETLTVVLIGHIVDTDLRDTVDRMNVLDGVVVADVKLAMPHPEKESSAIIDIVLSEAGAKDSRNSGAKKALAMKRLDEIAKEKKLLVIRSLEVRA